MGIEKADAITGALATRSRAGARRGSPRHQKGAQIQSSRECSPYVWQVGRSCGTALMPDYRIQRATVSDVLVIARHRVDMFQEMGELVPDEAAIVESASRTRLVGQLVSWRVRRLARGNGRPGRRRRRRVAAPVLSNENQSARPAHRVHPSTSTRNRDIDDKDSRINSLRRFSPRAVRRTSRAPACTRPRLAGRCTSDSGLRRRMR